MVKEGAQFGQLLREVVDLRMLIAIAAQRVGLQRRAAGRPADTEIDTPRIKRVERLEGFRDL